MKKLILMLLLFSLICSFALGEERINLSTEGSDQLYFCGFLPDGRLLFSGSAAVKGNYHKAHARLLCLNPDLSVSFDYRNPANGECRYALAAVLPDGSIGAVFRNDPYQNPDGMEIHRLSADGERLGEPIELTSSDSLIDGVTPQCVAMTIYPADAEVGQRYFLDWEGNLLFRFSTRESISGGYHILPAPDGLMLLGSTPEKPTLPKIMKVDMHGNTLWENVLPGMVNDGFATMEWPIATSDGGFLTLIMDRGGNINEGVAGMQWGFALTKFDSRGRVEWENRTALTDPTRMCNNLVEYGDYYVMALRNNTLPRDEVNRFFLWFDHAGQLLGETSFALGEGEINYGLRLVPAANGLWALADIRQEKEEWNILEEMDTLDMVLLPVPEFTGQ